MTAMEVILIAAVDRNLAIGRDNTLPWHLPDDLKRFKELTLGQPLLMGRKTAEAIGRVLPGRRNLVLTRSGRVPFPGMEAVDSVEAALHLASQADADRLCVIGGGEIYALCLPIATRMHLTHVDTEVAGADAFFPAWEDSRWQKTACEPHPADSRHAYGFRFVEYAPAQAA